MSIKVNMQITGNSAEFNDKYFPRLFDGDKQIRDISIIYSDGNLDIQTTIASGDLLKRSVDVWINAEEIKLNKQLAEIQRKLEILKEVKGV